jgi:hypothetical protein
LSGKKPSEGDIRPVGIIVATAIFLFEGIYNMAFPALFDPSLIPLVAIGALCFITAASLFLKRKIAFYLALLLFPIMLTQGALALYTNVNSVGWRPDYATATFNASLVAYMLGLLLALLLVLDKRATLRPISVPMPFLGRSPAGTAAAKPHETEEESGKQASVRT